MKRTLSSIICLICALFLAPSTTVAQEAPTCRVSYQGEASFIFAGAAHWTIGGRTTHGVQIGDKWFVGAGAGYISTLNPDGPNCDVVPVYANGRYYIKRKKNSPYVDLSLGYCIASSDFAAGGVYLAPMVGYNFRLRGRLSLDLGLGYLYLGQSLKTPFSKEPFARHSPEIRLGLRF